MGFYGSRRRRRRHRTSVLLTVAAFALGAGACGGSDDDGGGEAEADGSGGGTASLPKDAFTPSSADEKAVVTVYSDYANAMAGADAKGACATLAPVAQRTLTGGGDCVKHMENLFNIGRQSQNKPYIAKLTVTGRKAKAQVKVKTDKTTYPVDFTQASGQWKISGAGAPAG